MGGVGFAGSCVAEYGGVEEEVPWLEGEAVGYGFAVAVKVSDGDAFATGPRLGG